LKIARALEKADSEYAAICADDDFIVPKSIEQCVRFLEANSGYSVASGSAARIVTYVNYRNSQYSLHTYTYRQRTIESDEPRLRLRDHLGDYVPTFYSVHRRLDLIHNMQLAYDNTSDNLCLFAELLPSCLSLVQGKAKRLNILYMVRQSHPDSEAAGAIPRRAGLALDDFPQRYVRFRNCLAEELASVTHMSVAEAGDVVDDAFQVYRKHLLSEKSDTVRRAQRLLRVLPTSIRLAFFDRQLLAMLQAPLQVYHQLQFEHDLLCKQDDDMLINKLLDHRSPFHTDFLPIYELMMRYPCGISTQTS
jgi:hypothetical protein